MNPRITAIVLFVLAVLTAGIGGYFMGKSNSAPSLKSSRTAAQPLDPAKKLMYYRCPMHPWVTADKPSKCPICAMDLTPVYEDAGQGSGIKVDASVVQTIGVTTEQVSKRDMAQEIRLSAVIQPDQQRDFSVTSRIMGYIEKLYANTSGQRVAEGQPLLELYSPDVVTAQEEYLRARQSGDSSLAASARLRLANWDIPASLFRTIEQTGKAQRLVPIDAPVTGVVMDKAVVQGQNVIAGTQMFRIVDLSKVWAVGQAYQNDLPFIKTGQPAHIALEYLPGRDFGGTVSFIGPELDPVSRTAQVRIEITNTPDLSLRPGMAATIVITSRAASGTIAIPEQAVLHSGVRDVAIVSLGNGYFEPREVALGVHAGTYVQVLSGLKEFEHVVTSSQFLIDSESNLREAVKKLAKAEAGDTVHHHPGMDTMDRPASSGSLQKTVSPINASVPATQLVPQKTCPIMGGPINKKLFVDYKGKRIYVCCTMCIAEVKKDPEKAIKILADRGEMVEKIK